MMKSLLPNCVNRINILFKISANYSLAGSCALQYTTNTHYSLDIDGLVLYLIQETERFSIVHTARKANNKVRRMMLSKLQNSYNVYYRTTAKTVVLAKKDSNPMTFWER